MPTTLAHLSLLVPDYDEAIAHYTQAFGFEVLQDLPLAPGKRWVLVAPPGHAETGQGAALLLAKAGNAEQAAFVGRQTGGRVFLFLHTDRFDTTLASIAAHGGRLTEAVRHEAYGRVVVVADRYGNLWDVIEPIEPVATAVEPAGPGLTPP
jgi:predicted enzyme related to lactoylglutathione lyase